MAPVRHRRRLDVLRLLAVLVPVVALTLAVAAVALDGPWPRVAAVSVAVMSAGLGAMVLRLDRRLRTAVAGARAEQAAEYSAVHLRASDEHREFADHMVGLLDVAFECIDVMRARLEPPRPAEHTDSDDLWPDTSDAPTVVDLIIWDDKKRELGADSGPGDQQERSA